MSVGDGDERLRPAVLDVPAPLARREESGPVELVETGGEGPLVAPLREVIQRFAVGATTPEQHRPLAVFAEVIDEGASLEEVDARLRALSHGGYLRGSLVVMAASQLRRPRVDICLRLAEELCDALDVELGVDLAGAILRLEEVRYEAMDASSIFARANLLLADTLSHRADHEAAARHYDAVLAVDIDDGRALRGWTRCVEALERRGLARPTGSRGLTLLADLEKLELAGSPGLERYELGRPLGRGRHAVVYEAFDRRVGRSVAIKRLLAQSARGDGLSDRIVDRHFFAEARTLARVRSAHVVSLLDVQPRYRFVALELCRGGNLRVAMRRRRVGPDDLPRVGQEIARALSAVHAVGAIHRDLKPANLLLRTTEPNSPVALADFGLAVEGEAKGAKSRAGTLRYLAPELRAGGRATPAADWFAAGVVLLELASFPNPLPPTFDRLDAGEDPRDALDASLPISPQWRDRLARWLHPDPEQRGH